jgi:hypothetical protein
MWSEFQDEQKKEKEEFFQKKTGEARSSRFKLLDKKTFDFQV